MWKTHSKKKVIIPKKPQHPPRELRTYRLHDVTDERTIFDSVKERASDF